LVGFLRVARPAKQLHVGRFERRSSITDLDDVVANCSSVRRLAVSASVAALLSNAGHKAEPLPRTIDPISSLCRLSRCSQVELSQSILEHPNAGHMAISKRKKAGHVGPARNCSTCLIRPENNDSSGKCQFAAIVDKRLRPATMRSTPAHARLRTVVLDTPNVRAALVKERPQPATNQTTRISSTSPSKNWNHEKTS
jgi:hypothetical protein